MRVKLIGIEPVEYINYVGKKVSGTHVSFVAPLDPNAGTGSKCFREWLTSAKITSPLQLESYYDATFENGYKDNPVLTKFVLLDEKE